MGPNLEKKTFNFELKSDEAGSISGYGSVFGALDKGNDIVVAGAFAKSILARRPKMLWNHDPNTPIGIWDDIFEDQRGLGVKGRFADTPKAQEIRSLVNIGAIDGLSIGYQAEDYAYEGSTRLLKSVNLWEVSLVTFPMLPSATVTASKAATMTKREVEEVLRDAGFSAQCAKALLAKGYEGISQRDAADDTLTQLLAALEARVSR